jgi:BON domain
MNQRDDTPGREHAERGRDFHGGGQGFEGTSDRAYEGQGASGRGRPPDQMQFPQGQYERDPHAQGPTRFTRDEREQERWHGGFERPPSYRSRQGAGRWPPQNEYGHGQSYGEDYERHYGARGPDRERSESDRYRPVTEEWQAARGYGEDRSGGYGSAEGGYGVESRNRGPGIDRYGRYGRYGRESGGSPQPDYGTGTHRNARPSWQQDPYGFSQGQRRDPYQYRRESPEDRARDRGPYPHERSSEKLFEREPFERREDVHYYGTGAPGWGGPGFGGGAYAYGYGPRYPTRAVESEYSDESAVGYGGSSGRGYGRAGGYSRPSGYGTRQYARGPKGYQRSDERLKEDISERLMEAYDIDSSEVTVDVKGAKVFLEGVVPSRHMKHVIEDMVDACPGVQDIENRIRVSSPNYQGSAAPSSGSSPQPSTPSGAAQASAGGSTSTGAEASPGGNAGAQTNSPMGSRTRQ